MEATLAQRWFLTTVVPLVVLPNDTLWTAFYDDEGRLESEPVSTTNCTFYVGHPSLDATDMPKQRQAATISHLHFLTLAGLKDLLESFDPRRIDWDYWVPDDVLEGFARR